MSSTPSRAAELRRDAQRQERSRASRVRARAAFSRSLRIIRPMAWILLVGVVVLAAVGVSLGWTELSVAALVAGAVLVISLVFLVGGTNYDITLDLNRDRVVVGDRAFGSLSLTNSTGRSIPAARVVLPVGSGRGAFDIPRLGAGEAREELFSVPTHVRGVIPVGPVSVLRGDPLGLYERVDARRDAIDLYVHPRTVPLQGLSLGSVRDLEGLSSPDLASDDVSFHALRPYVHGDDLRHVHWRSTARVGEVVIRQYEQTRRSTFVIGLSTHPSEYADADEFELAVSIAGSVGLRAVQDSPDVAVVIPGRQLSTVSGSRLLDELSGVGTVRASGSDVDGISIAMAAARRSLALAVFVCGSDASPPGLRTAVARMPVGVRTVVLQADAGASPLLRRIGEATAVSVGAIDQLPSALRRVLA